MNITFFKFLDRKLFQSANNHPVHILDDKGKLSSSSFIPFCSFGENIIGEQLNGFDVPVCNIFKPKNYFDQICYEANLEDLKDTNNIENLTNQLKLGLSLAIDYNADRQLKYKNQAQKNFNNHIGNSSRNLKLLYLLFYA